MSPLIPVDLLGGSGDTRTLGPGGAQPKETTVWIKPLDLPWEQVGTGVFQGITPENVNLEADTWGPSNATFDLRREPDAPALDLSAGAEVEVHVAGVNVWDGFVSSTPKKRGDLVVSVVCRGWQDELDGRIFTAGYVHSSLADWKDMRSSVTANLAALPAGFSVSTGDGAITLTQPYNSSIGTGTLLGVYLDLGPNLLAKRMSFTYSSNVSGNANFVVYVRGCDTPDTTWAAVDDAYAAQSTTGPTTTSGTFATGHRYVQAFVYYSGAAIKPNALADFWWKITDLKVYTDTAYESGNASILKASTVVVDALAKGTLALSSDTSGIDSTSFNIPDLWPDPKGLTARELISKVNAYHNWTAKLVPGRRFIFTPRSTVPKVKVGEWSALPDDEDASANDITDIYNHCRATSTEPGGTLVVVDRYSRDTALAKYVVVDVPSVTTTGATMDRSITSSYIVTKGKQYRIDFDGLNFRRLEVGGVDVLALKSWGFSTYVFVAPVSGTVTATARWGGTGVTSFFTLEEEQSTVLNRRNRVRSMVLDASAALPADGVALTQLADTWLAAHMTTPFKGKQSIQGAHSVRDYLTGDNVAPERLLAMTTDLLHFDDRINPDTGDVGRDGRIVKVSYQPMTDTVQTDVDSTRNDFAVLLNRIGVLASAG